MPLTRLQLTAFRGFDSLDLSFEPRLTVLVGRNGSGKTTVLDAIVAPFAGPLKASDIRAGSATTTIHLSTPDGTYTHTDGQLKNIVHSGKFEHPFTLFYRVGRNTLDQTPGSTAGEAWNANHAYSHWFNASGAYDQLFHWLREMEDLENERIRHREGETNPLLDAVRSAVTSLIPGFSAMRVRRQLLPLSMRPALTLEKDGIVLPFDAFSEGERNAVAMVADIARRLALLDSDAKEPLGHEALILIDEIEQHLHPGWQRHVMRKLPIVFPGTQFVVTTQSPVIVSEVSEENLRVLDQFKLVETHHHRGRDANSVLEETFQVSARPDEIKKQIETLADKLDERKLDEAEQLLGSLEKTLGLGDPEMIYYRNIYDRLRPHR